MVSFSVKKKKKWKKLNFAGINFDVGRIDVDITGKPSSENEQFEPSKKMEITFKMVDKSKKNTQYWA